MAKERRGYGLLQQEEAPGMRNNKIGSKAERRVREKCMERDI